ncbi:MAG: hypothetical protein HY729_07640, partial [Candidatus Rokubacteria bacterium]|nr:hypothetical protein [Candidatus Rokubacteria bacterium]
MVKYPTWPNQSQPKSCEVCHAPYAVPPGPTKNFNPYGAAFNLQANKYANLQAALATIADQILFGTFPGNPGSKPGVPGGVKASDATFEDKGQVTWSAYTNAAFHLYRATDSPDGTKAQITSTSSTQYADT